MPVRVDTIGYCLLCFSIQLCNFTFGSENGTTDLSPEVEQHLLRIVPVKGVTIHAISCKLSVIDNRILIEISKVPLVNPHPAPCLITRGNEPVHKVLINRSFFNK